MKVTPPDYTTGVFPKMFYNFLDKLSKRTGPIDTIPNIRISSSIAKRFAQIWLKPGFLSAKKMDSAKGKDQKRPPIAPNPATVGISSQSPLPPKTGPRTGINKVRDAIGMSCLRLG